tara:strand:- start:32 stop:1576 length:1545 start_codon:yes stop_codon:yes gene_type:complete
MKLLALLLLALIPSAQDGTPDPVASTPASTAGGLDDDQAVPDEVMLLRMRDGSIHWGSMQDHDPDRLVFQLLSHGGVVDVPWSLLDPQQSGEMRLTLGYIDVASEELLIEVERLLLIDGNEVTGVIESRQGDNFTVRTGGHQQLLPKERVRSISSGIQVPALDVYSREQLYGRELAVTEPDNAEAQLALAEYCERILDFVHAVEHYQTALQLGLTTDAEKVTLALGRAEIKADKQDQVDVLRQADVLRKRGQFDDALASLETFRTTWPDSPLMEDALKKVDQVKRARDRALREYVTERWFYWMRRLARDAAKMDFQQMIGYADETLGQDIRAKVLEDVQKGISESIQDVEIEALWATRKKTRFLNASYGNGTWLLGDDRALAGGEKDKKPAAEGTTGLDKERADLEKKIEQFLKNQRRARSARSGADAEEDQAEGWASFAQASRAQWVLSYYVEFSGDLEVRDHPFLRNCKTCAGRGVIEQISVGGGGKGDAGVTVHRCPLCHGVGRVRRVYFR